MVTKDVRLYIEAILETARLHPEAADTLKRLCPKAFITPVVKHDLESWFNECTADLELRVDEEAFPNRIFYFKDGCCWFSYDYEIDMLACDLEKYWRQALKLGYSNYEIKSSTEYLWSRRYRARVIAGSDVFKHLVDKHFNSKPAQQ